MATDGAAPAFLYRPGFFAPDEAEALFARLLGAMAWQREWLTLYGRRRPVPRLLAWCGEPGIRYRYSGTDHVCDGWLPGLAPVRDTVAAASGVAANLVLLNRYRNGADYMGWHRDDERGLASRIASVSLGARRRFLIRLPGEPRARPLDLEPGSLLVMEGALRHALPRTRKPVGERINLTFRRLEPPPA